ncbi:MAG: metallophosphoesterase [Candidatus Thermoplasmatota archaeon]
MDIGKLADEVIETPDRVTSIDHREVVLLLENVKTLLSEENVLVDIIDKPVVFVGDTHGDFETTKAVVKRYLSTDRVTVFMGDYIDRSPVEYGSIYNITYLFFLKYMYHDRFILLKGNHESNNVIPCYPYSFKDEVTRYFKSSSIYNKYVEVFSNLPLMVTANGVYAAHGGFIPGLNKDKLFHIDKNDRYAIEMIVWSDPYVSPTFRGIGYRFKEEELKDFLRGVNADLFIRGHDYHTLGVSIYNDKCLTIFTSTLYKDQGNGGILVAEVDKDINSLKDVKLMDYSTGEWLQYKVKKL